jgi:hypothetical protein
VNKIKRAVPCKDDDNYEYGYREPEDLFMDGVEALLRHRLTESRWCRCGLRCKCENVLRLLPKKINGRLMNELWATGYGLKAITAWSFIRTVAAFILLQVPPLIFAIRWLIGHPGDLQNAFLLEVLLISMLNIFVVLPDHKLVDKLN